ncbi:hypothetical protein DMUE_3123 [Dictyocoela muelleri]|nr:hypothetical protein DMUE_3123 [Dictyocoela muelleri]
MNKSFENKEEMIFVKTERKNYALIYKNHLYYFKKIKTSSKIWKCHDKKCNCKLITDEEKNLNEKEIIHTRIPLTNDDLKKIIVINNIKKLAKESYLNTKQIFSEVFKNLDSAEISKISKHRSIYRMINRVRDENFFNYDSTNDIPSELKTTTNCTKYLQYDSGVLYKERIIILANSERLMFLKNSSTWLADRTFKMAPYNFHQI